MGLLDNLLNEGKKYIRDAMPGGLLNPEITKQSMLDGAAIASTPVPVAGDLLGLLADVNRYKENPEERTAGNFALTGLGLLPFVPAMTSLKGAKEAPRAEAMRIAQQNAAKPVSEGGLGLRPDNTPMERKVAMGGVDVFHGQAKTPEKRIYEDGVYLGTEEPKLLPIEQLRANGGNAEGGAFYAIDDAQIASMFAQPTKQQSGAVYPLVVFPKNMKESGFTQPMPEGDIGAWMDKVEQYNRGLDRTKNRYFSSELKAAKAEGKDGVIFRNTEDLPSGFDFGYAPSADVYAISNPAIVRSRFAAFDPFRRHEADLLGQADPRLLGAIAGGGLLGGYAYQDK